MRRNGLRIPATDWLLAAKWDGTEFANRVSVKEVLSKNLEVGCKMTSVAGLRLLRKAGLLSGIKNALTTSIKTA